MRHKYGYKNVHQLTPIYRKHKFVIYGCGCMIFDTYMNIVYMNNFCLYVLAFSNCSYMLVVT